MTDDIKEIQRLQKEIHEYLPPFTPFQPEKFPHCDMHDGCGNDVEIQFIKTHQYYHPTRVFCHCVNDINFDLVYTPCDLCGVWIGFNANAESFNSIICCICNRCYCSIYRIKSYCRFDNDVYQHINYLQVYETYCDVEFIDEIYSLSEQYQKRIDMLNQALEWYKNAFLKPAERFQI